MFGLGREWTIEDILEFKKFHNRKNGQIILIPNKKQLSRDVKRLFEDDKTKKVRMRLL